MSPYSSRNYSKLIAPLGLILAFASIAAIPLRAADATPNTYTIRSITQAPKDLVSPEVHADRTITFRVKAPQAKAVALHFGEWDVKPQPLAKDADGVWSLTIGPVAPQIYHYTFSIDGTRAIDLENGRTKIGLAIDGSVVEVTADPPRLDQVTAGAKGVLHIHTYRSSSLGRDRRVVVYTPAGYNPNEAKTYPVLYLRHGGGDTELSWSNDGRAHVIADNLIRAGKVSPMLIVMTDGMVDRTWAGSTSPEAVDKLEQELLQDVIPLVESNYRVSQRKDDRAIAGLSMGGGHAFIIGLRNLDTFGWIGQFSSGLLADKDLNLDTLLPGILANPTKVNESLHLLWIACGDRDPRFQGHLDLVKTLEGRHVKTTWHQTPGGHEWKVWRAELAEFLPHLFTATKP